MRSPSRLRRQNATTDLLQKKSDAIRRGAVRARPKRRKREYFVVHSVGESTRDWIERNLDESYAGYLFEVCMALLSVFMVLLYVVINWNHLILVNEPWVDLVDFYINVMFTVEYLLRLYAAHDRLDYLRSFFRIAEFLVLLPSWLDFATAEIFNQPIQTGGIFNVIRGMRSLRILRTYRFLQFTTSSLQRQIGAAMLTVICITVSTAGLLQVIENCWVECLDLPRVCRCQSLSFLNFLYFVVVSISTLGYGDIAPVSPEGKFLISFIILLTFIIVPIQVNRIAAIISSHTDYSSSYTEAKQYPHIIITGYIDVQMLTTFFSQFFHSNNLNWSEKVVILNTRSPTPEVKKLLNTMDSKVKYLVGSPLLDEDLGRAVLHHARACFVLVNRNALHPQYSDQCTALITIALRRGNPTCPIYAQVINAQNSSTILKMGASDVIVEGLMKSSILARSCEVRGLPTLLSHLLAQSHSNVDQRQSLLQWQKPYLHGYMYSIHLIDIPRTFSGFTFGDLIRFLYEKTSVVPLALLTEDGVQFVDLEFKLGATADPNLCCKVYAVAKGINAIEGVAQIPPEQILSYRKNLRRKVKSPMDMVEDAEEQQASLPVKPALGNEIDQIRRSIIKTYTMAIKHEFDESGVEYEEFATIGAPMNIVRHIIVCGFPMDTLQFLKTIREAPPIDDEFGSPPVVFLAPEVIDEDEYASIRVFPQVYFVQGSPVNFADLKKTRIEGAAAVLILTCGTASAYADPNMIDADAITTLRYIVEISQRTNMPNLVVELDRPTNVKLLSSLANDRRASATFSLPSMVSRQISYRSPRRGSSRRESSFEGVELYGGSDFSSSLVLEEFISSGRVYMNSTLDSLLSECYRKQWITQFVHILVNGRADDREQRRLFQVEVPDEFISLPFSSCVRKCLDTVICIHVPLFSYYTAFVLFLILNYHIQANCVCIGLWRPERGIILPHPCVFLCPPPDLQVEPHDLMYLVGKPFTFADAQMMWAR